MKTIIQIFFAFAALMNFAYAQSYLISSGGTVNSCSGSFFDSGDSSNFYGANEDYIITFHSNNGAAHNIRMVFQQFNIDISDTLFIYDGSDIFATPIGAFNNSHSLLGLAIESSFLNVSGDLTFRFKSDGISEATGWRSILYCIQPCQQIIAAYDSSAFSPMPDDSGYVDICPGVNITFAALGSGPGVFPQNNIYYSQSASTSLFIWDFGDGSIDTGMVVNHSYAAACGYNAKLTVIDVHGCQNTNIFYLKIRVSGNPIRAIIPIQGICLPADTFEITAGYGNSDNIQLKPVGHGMSLQALSQSEDSTMFIPDGPVCGTACNISTMNISGFGALQTITDSSDIASVCVNIEHSFGGDLGFTVICPNGQSVVLAPNLHSGGMGLGISKDGGPYDSSTYPCDPAYNIAGTGWTYCWSEIYSTVGTYNSQCNGTNNPIDSVNQIDHTGYFQTNNPFSGFIGCPLNGTWTLKICDDWSSDNGYLFDWTLNFGTNMMTGPFWSYNVPIDSITWSGNNIISTTDTSVFVYPTSPGIYSYSMTIYDNFGCSYDTTISVNVYPAATTPVIVQNGTILYSSALSGNQWYINNVAVPGEIYSNIGLGFIGNYFVIVTDSNGCVSDTSNIIYNDGSGLSDFVNINDQIFIFPNPANNCITIETAYNTKDAVIFIMNIQGQLLLKQALTQGKAVIDVSGFAEGMYFVKVSGDGGVAVKKFLKN